MMQVLDPTYTIKVVVKDRTPTMAPNQLTGVTFDYQGQVASTQLPGRMWYSSFGEETGCDKLLAVVRKALSDAGVKDATVTLERFGHE